jgi:hypothetical protein
MTEAERLRKRASRTRIKPTAQGLHGAPLSSGLDTVRKTSVRSLQHRRPAPGLCNTCNFIAIDIYPRPADEEFKNGRHAAQPDGLTADDPHGDD